MIIYCPYCNQKYSIEADDTADIVFTCNNCNKLVGLYHKIDTAKKIAKFVEELKALQKIGFALIAIIGLFFFFLNFQAYNIPMILTTIIYCLVCFCFYWIGTNLIICRYEAMEFQTQKQYEMVELQKYLISQIKMKD